MNGNMPVLRDCAKKYCSVLQVVLQVVAWKVPIIFKTPGSKLVDIHGVLVDIELNAVCWKTSRKGLLYGVLPIKFGENCEQP